MLHILFRFHPELKKDFHHSLSVNNGRRYGMSNKDYWNFQEYELTIEFPKKYRDEVLNISKFCDISFIHEFWEENITIFKTDYVNFN